MAKASGGIRGFARSRGYSLTRLTGNRTSGGQYRYAIRGRNGNMRARNARDAASLIRSADRFRRQAEARRSGQS